jgi:hypothetical protein
MAAGVLELIVLVVFLVVPALLGYGSGSYWSAVLPGVALAAALAYYAGYEKGPVADEVDVIPGALVISSAVAVGVCLGAAALRRRGRRRAGG